MPEAHVEIVRASLEAWNGGDWDASMEHYHPEIEWRAGLPDTSRTTFIGHDGVREFWRIWSEIWTSIVMLPDEFVEIGDDVVVAIRFRAAARQGLELDQSIAMVFTLRDGLVIRFRTYSNMDQALAAVEESER